MGIIICEFLKKCVPCLLKNKKRKIEDRYNSLVLELDVAEKCILIDDLWHFPP